jgi:ArsR family transcriptional regulator
MNSENDVKNLFHVLGNSNRLRLFDLLMTGVHCNCELTKITGMANNLISHHLKVLQDAELIQSVRSTSDARWIYYSINKDKIQVVQEELQNFLDLSRLSDREPACPPCKTKKEQEKVL